MSYTTFGIDVRHLVAYLWVSHQPLHPSDIIAYKKASSCIAQYPAFRTAQSALHFISLAHLFNQTLYQLFWEASPTLQIMREGCSYKYSPLSIARYSFIQLSKLEQRRGESVQSLTPQHRIRIWVLLVESQKLYY